ncbi:MAG: glutamate synthase large subunit, partial [Geminicoccaceae bacterium]
ELFGDANDYVGKGLSGGTIAIRPLLSSPIVPHENVIIGNTCLYGATAGKLFAAGQAGERFAVRNSGAITVVEGCGDNGCEYMTGGTAVILGRTGDNFAAGMSGGMAFVYDPENRLWDPVRNRSIRVNDDMVVCQRVEVDHYAKLLEDLLIEHVGMTQSALAQRILNDFELERQFFWQIVPTEMLDKLEVPVTLPTVAQTA